MVDSATISGWLAELGRRSEVPLTLDEDGVCGFQLNADLPCYVQASAEDPFLNWTITLAVLPSDDLAHRTRVLNTCCEWNYLEEKTRGTQLALDPGGRLIIMTYRRLREHLDQPAFFNITGNLFETALVLFDHLRRFTAAPQAEARTAVGFRPPPSQLA